MSNLQPLTDPGAPELFVDAAGNTYRLAVRHDEPVPLHMAVANSVREGLRQLSAATEIPMKDLTEQALREFLARHAANPTRL